MTPGSMRGSLRLLEPTSARKRANDGGDPSANIFFVFRGPIVDSHEFTGNYDLLLCARFNYDKS